MPRIKKELDMGSGKFIYNIFRFSLPIALSGVLQCLYNAADMVVVGRWGEKNSLAAVGATGSPTGLLVNLFLGLSIGASVVVSKALGEGDRKKIKNAVSTSLLVGFFAGVLVSLLGLLFCEKLLVLMGVPEDIMGKSALYVKIFFLGAPASLFYNFVSAVFRAGGNTKTPLYVSLFAGILNVFLNCILVIVFKMDVAGVAVATAIANYFSAILSLYLLRNETVAKGVSLRKTHFEKSILKDILVVGVPSGINAVMYSISNMLINTRINSFGTDYIGGHAVGLNISGFLYQLNVTPFAQSSVSFIAYNYGAKKYENFKKIIGAGIFLSVITGAVITAVVMPIRYHLAHIYTGSSVEAEIGVLFITMVGVTHWILGISDTLNGAIRGMGKSFMAMVISIIGICGVRIIFTEVLFHLYPTMFCLYISYPISWIITILMQTAVFIGLYRKTTRRKES